MTTRNLLAKRSFIPDTLGNPATGHYMHILEPGSLSTRVTSYQSGDLLVENANPVPLGGGGKASVWVSLDCDVRITLGNDVNGPLLSEDLNANPDTSADSDSGLVPNGSFETDSDADGVPDGWTLSNAGAGSTNEIDTTQSSSGLQSWKSIGVGTGGGDLETTAFFSVNETSDIRVQFDLNCTIATIRNIVEFDWYDVSEVFISTSTIYDEAVNNPLVYATQSTLVTPPAGARLAKLKFRLVDASDVTAGQANIDRVRVFYPETVSGIFDNITISGNQVASTNTDGDINLEPDGDGDVVSSERFRTNKTSTQVSRLEAWDGEQYNPVFARRVLRKAIQETLNNTDVLQDDDDLFIALTAGVYLVELYLLVQCPGSTVPDIKVALSYSGTLLDGNGILWTGPVLAVDGTGQIATQVLSVSPTGVPFGVPMSSTDSGLIHGVALMDASGAGTLQLEWAQNVSNGNFTVMAAESRMVVTKLGI